jgi:hypothetical protein
MNTTNQINSVLVQMGTDVSEDSGLTQAILFQEEQDMMLLSDARFFGPDYDEGSNDSDGNFYWDN